MATFPSAVPPFVAKTDGAVIEPVHLNDLGSEIMAVATHLLVTPPGPVTTPVTVTGSEPSVALHDLVGGALKGRAIGGGAGAASLAVNATIETGTWQADEAAGMSLLLTMAPSTGSLYVAPAAGGAAARTWVDMFVVGPTGTQHQMGRPVAIGEWSAYTPVWSSAGGTAPTLGNATLTGRYAMIGKTVHCRINFTLGSTSVQGSGWWTFTLPVPGVGWLNWDPMGQGRIVQGAAQRTVHISSTGTGTTLYMTVNGSGGVLGPGVPWTWAAGSVIYLAFTYEIP